MGLPLPPHCESIANPDYPAGGGGCLRMGPSGLAALSPDRSAGHAAEHDKAYPDAGGDGNQRDLECVEKHAVVVFAGVKTYGLERNGTGERRGKHRGELIVVV